MPIVVEGVETEFFFRWFDFLKSLYTKELYNYEGFSPEIKIYEDEELAQVSEGISIGFGDTKSNRLVSRYTYVEDVSIPW
jgi:hypothetical protein